MTEYQLPTHIVVPRLQRDYVQGANEPIINSFVSSLMDIEKSIDLTYIYGNKNQSGFEPIDGQQRLTTIWLLKLCLCKKCKVTFEGECNYIAREYAHDFCRRLKDAGIEDAKHPEKAAWFIHAWHGDSSVEAMLGAIKTIWHYMPEDITKAQEILDSLDSRLKYSFRYLDDTINDDVYIKMNRRGVQLTPYENLKSWLDDRTEEMDLHEDWQRKIDGAWAEAIWDMICKSEDDKDLCTDDLMLSSIYALLFLYWIRNKDKFYEAILGDDSETSKDDDSETSKVKEKNARYILGIEDEDDLFIATMKLIGPDADKSSPELYILDSLPIFSTEAIQFIHDRFDTLCAIYNQANGAGINFHKKQLTKSLSEYVLTENTYFNRALIYAMTQFCGNTHTPYTEWLYRLRNLLVNSEINAQTFGTILNSIDKLAEYCNHDSIDEIFKMKSEEINKLDLSGFKKIQIEEEKLKTALSSDAWTEVRKLENHLFFLGRVSFLFDFAGDKPELEDLKPYLYYMDQLFDPDSFKEGLRKSIRHALLPIGWFGSYGRYDNWSFINGSDELNKFVYDNKANKDLQRNSPHNWVLGELIRKLYDKYGLVEPSSQLLAELSKATYDSLEVSDIRKYFSHLRSWKYMEKNQMHETDNGNILLYTKLKGSCHRIDLFNHYLFCEWTSSDSNGKLRHENLFPGWECKRWSEIEDGVPSSCVYIERKLQDGLNIAIDIFHDGSNVASYKISAFVRNNQDATKAIFESILSKYEDGFEWVKDRYTSNSGVLLKDLQPIIAQILSDISKCVTF